MMKRMLQLALLSAGLFLSSCAYVQTHKNVEEMSTHYEGQMLNAATMELYESGGAWYISAAKARFKLSYPIVHDEVFRKSFEQPSFRLIHADEQMVYHPISSHAAQILRQSDGYFELKGLAEEIQRTPGAWVSHLPAGAVKHAIAADIAGNPHQYMEELRIPREKPIGDMILGKLDFVVVDIPATLAYNVAIPFMAPFVFFYEFFQES